MAFFLATNCFAQLPSIPIGYVSVELQSVATGLSSPIDLVSAHDGSGRLFIVEQVGRIRVLNNGTLSATPFLDVIARTLSSGEQGLLGLAFHPGFANSASPGFRKLYTYSNERTSSGTPDFTVPMSGSPSSHVVVAEWQVSTANPNAVDTSTRREVLRFTHPASNHNAGKIAFRASDGFLYIASGDGGNANDVGDGHTPNIGNAQDTSNLLGKILRIDPLAPALTSGSPNPMSANGKYRVAADNPFVNAAGLDEIYAYGFRNPYRFSFDAVSNQLLVGDVGQGAIEEVDIVERGKNYGWNRKEGGFLFNPANGSVSPDTNPNPSLTNPILQYDHGDGISVIGGFISRGSAIPALAGKYVFGDYLLPSLSSGRLFYSDLASGAIQELIIGINPRKLGFVIKGFGTDDLGEIYAMLDSSSNTAGQISKLVAIPATPALLNLSTRARVENDDGGTAIAGFIVRGSVPKTLVLRARGPSLTVNGQPVPGRLTNPTLTLVDPAGTVLDSNDDWMTHPRRQELVAYGLQPPDNADAAFVTTLQPGAYTAMMRGVNGGTGVGLIELYDPNPSENANAVNLSTRGRVQTGDNVMIGGLIIGGNGNQRVIVRGIGPSLAAKGVAGALQNPTLELVNANGATIGSNDNWRSDQQAEISASGLAPSDDAEAAIIRTLAPGGYTAIVRGAGNTSGVGLVEVYRLSP
jgi:glucose/arabinose dehydrogenase